MAILQNKFVREGGSIIGSSVIISCKYTSEVNSQTNLTVGDTTADEVEVECRVLDKEITAGEKLTYYQIEDGVENLIGTFYAEAPTKATKTSIRFKAYDGKAKLAADFSEWLNDNQGKFPMTLRSLVGYACEVAGVPLAADNFQFESLSIPAFYADGVTCRQVISWAAQIAGCFVKCNSDGKICFGWYRSTDISVTKSLLVKDSLSKKTYSTDLIKRVQFKQETNDVGVIYPADADGNVFSISQNGLAALLDSDTLRTIAEYLYGKLKDITYTPLSFTMARTALIKAGDVISVTDGNGETVSTYVMKVYLDSSGTQISSTGDQNYADKAAVSSKQYANILGKVLNISKSVDGLRIENRELEDKYAKLSVTVDGIGTEVASAQGDISSLQQTATELLAEIEDANGNIAKIEEKAGTVDITVTKVREDGKAGTLTTKITGDGSEAGGEWTSVYTIDGTEASSLRFDFAQGRFVFNGTGEFWSEDGNSYIRLTGKAFELYTKDASGGFIKSADISVVEDASGNVYPYLTLVKSDDGASNGAFRLFRNGVWVGNGAVGTDDNMNFVPIAESRGMFLDSTGDLVTPYIYTGLNGRSAFEAVFA